MIEAGQQYGPLTADQLAAAAAAGSVTPQAQVWTEGLAEWVPATQVEGLFPPPGPTLVIPAAAPVFAGAGAGALPGMQPAPTPAAAGEYPPAGVKSASFQFVAGLMVVGILLALVGLFISTRFAERPGTAAQAGLLGVFLLGLGVLCWLPAAVIQCIYLHRAWRCLRFGDPRTTPGRAVGLLFIPFFNCYWCFTAWHGLACDWNRIVGAFPDLRHAPRLPERLFLAFCICGIVAPPAALVLWFPVMGGLCRAINFMAFRPTHTPGAIVFR